MTLAAITLATILTHQDMSMFAPPKELEQAKFMLGNWNSKGKALGMDGKMSDVSGSSKCAMSMDRWIQWDTEDNMPGLGKMKGRFMLTYNPLIQKWEGNWSDSMTSYAMKLTGEFKGTTLTMLSEEVPGWDGTGTTMYRISYMKEGEKAIHCRIESIVEGNFVLMLDNHYSKK